MLVGGKRVNTMNVNKIKCQKDGPEIEVDLIVVGLYKYWWERN
jgi:hypothetical protein